MSWFSKRQRHSYGGEKKKNALLSRTGSEGEDHTPRQVLLESDSYGTHNPLDWNTMPLSLRERFPHWKEQEFPSPDIRRKDTDNENLRTLIKIAAIVPDNAIPYIVMETDTLVSIALKFDTTPGEIARINNKLLAGFSCIHPGQLLYIPDSEPICQILPADSQAPPTEDPDVKVSSSVELSSSVSKEDVINFEVEEEVTDKHIRIASKFMSEQLCVHGSLLLNEQSLMFQPNPCDPLVEDHGRDMYEVLIPLSEIVYVYMNLQYSPPGIENSVTMAPNVTSTFNSTVSAPLVFFPSPPPPFPPSQNHTHLSSSDDRTPVKHNNEVDEDTTPQYHHGNSTYDNTPSNVTLTEEDNTKDKSDVINSDNMFLEEIETGKEELSSPEELKHEKEITFEQYGDEPEPLPSPWIFLYIRVSQSSQQKMLAPVVGIEIPVDRKTPQSPSADIQCVRTWFIFAIPSKRFKDIGNFLLRNHPLSDDNTSSTVEVELPSGAERIEIINIHGQYSDDSLLINEGHFAPSSWDICSVRDIQPIKIECMEVENNLPLPNLLESSDLLSTKHLRKLTLNLVSRAIGHDWYLVYSTFKHGISLHTMYRNMSNFGDSPTVLIVQDDYGKLFGAMLSNSIKISDRFYGTGESLLFSFDEDEEISVYPWTGVNDYIIKGNTDSLAIGSGDGHFGLWLDESLYHGSSLSCDTFNNKQLTTSQDFVIHAVEAWGFV